MYWITIVYFNLLYLYVYSIPYSVFPECSNIARSKNRSPAPASVRERTMPGPSSDSSQQTPTLAWGVFCNSIRNKGSDADHMAASLFELILKLRECSPVSGQVFQPPASHRSVVDAILSAIAPAEAPSNCITLEDA